MQSREKLPNSNLKKLSKFNQANKLKKAALAYFASRTEDSEIKGRLEEFLALDKNSDGYITLGELKKGFETEDPTVLADIMKGLDIDSNGAIDYNEYIAANIDSRRISMSKSKLSEAFKVFDSNGDGVIEDTELAKMFHSPIDLVDEEIMNKVD